MHIVDASTFYASATVFVLGVDACRTLDLPLAHPGRARPENTAASAIRLKPLLSLALYHLRGPFDSAT